MRRNLKQQSAPGQSVFDAALEGYGDMRGVEIMLTDNPSLIPIMDNLEGTTVKLQDTYTDKTNVANIFSKRKPTSI